MPKTRQQRLAEERAGHPPSPPQHLEYKPRAPKRTRAEKPNVPEVARPVMPATQPTVPGVPDTQPAMPGVRNIQSAMPGVPDILSAMPGVLDTQSAMPRVPNTQSAIPGVPDTQSAMPGEPQALLCIWVDIDPENPGRPVGDAVLQEMIPSSRVPELVTFLKNIRNQEKNKEVAEAMPAENQTTVKPLKARKRAFRLNPSHATSSIFEPQPETTSLDTSTAGSIFYPQAGPPEIGPEIAPETAFATAPNNALEIAPATTPATAPVTTVETPRGSKWSIGNLFQSGSFKKFLGFSPLATVPDSPESVLQTPTRTSSQTLTAVSPLVTVPVSLESLFQTATPTPTTTTTQTFTAEPAPAGRNPRRSSPTSARDARAKQRRHNDSIIQPVNAGTTSKNQSDRRSRARKARPASGETKTATVEEEQFFDIIPRDRDQRGTRQVAAGAENPTAAPTIRWPSRSLDRMNQLQMNKRKRDDEPVAGPSRGSYGLGEADISRNNDEQPDIKIRRTSGSRGFTSQVAAAPKTPIPITNATGKFKVPSPGDSDWSDSGSDEEEEGNTAGSEDVKRSTCRNDNQESALANTSPGVHPEIKVPSSRRPISPPTLTQSEAVRKARENLLKYKPRNPSRLIQSSRAYPSPPTIGEAITAQRSPAPARPQAPVEVEPASATANAVDPQPTGRTTFNAYEEWRQTVPPAVRAVVDIMEVDNNMAGAMFERGLGDPDTGTGTGTSERTNRSMNAFEDWSRTASPTVLAVLDKMEVVDNEIAGQLFESGLDKFTQI